MRGSRVKMLRRAFEEVEGRKPLRSQWTLDPVTNRWSVSRNEERLFRRLMSGRA